MDPRAIDRAVTGAAAAHQRLLGHLDEAADVLDPTRPSRLPGWSVGHVLAHLARHADGVIRVLDAAGRGETVERYPGGPDGRAADIEAGARRPAAELIADVRRTAWRLEEAWAVLPAEGWLGSGTLMGNAEPVVELPWKRWREVEVHHADLDLPGFDWDDWSPEYVRLELERAEMAWGARRPMGLTTLPPAALALPPARRLAWLLGRWDPPGLDHVDPWW